MGALILDAFIDPAIGTLSDRTRSRWGRRHPWLYASALPIALGWIALWNPPAMSPVATLAVAVRDCRGGTFGGVGLRSAEPGADA